MKNKFALALLMVGACAVSGTHGFGISALKNAEVKKEEKVAQQTWRRWLCDDVVNPRWERLTGSAKAPAPTRFENAKQKISSGYKAIQNGFTSAKETVKERPYATTATVVAATAISAGAYGLYAQGDADSAE